jgi:hypothetical protein
VRGDFENLGDCGVPVGDFQGSGLYDAKHFVVCLVRGASFHLADVAIGRPQRHQHDRLHIGVIGSDPREQPLDGLAGLGVVVALRQKMNARLSRGAIGRSTVMLAGEN